MAAELPAGFEPAGRRVAEEFNQKAETLATRRASQLVLDALKPVLPELIGGSADLTGSNLTMAKTSKPIGPASSPNGGGGDYIFYGVRPVRMGAVKNCIPGHRRLFPF